MKKQKIFSNEIFGVNRLVWEENPPETDKPLTSEELAEAAEKDLTPLEIAAMQAGEAEARLQQAEKALAAVGTGSGTDAATRSEQADLSEAHTAADLADEQLGELTGSLAGSLAGSKEQEARFLNIPLSPEVPVPAAAPTPVPTPEAPAPAAASPAADKPAEPAAPAPSKSQAEPKEAVETTEKTEAQQKCEIMKKYVGEGKKISFANFEALLKKHGELDAATNLTTLDNLNKDDAGKVVNAVNKVQETARGKLPADNPLKDSPLVKDEIFGGKTFQACVDAKLINTNGALVSEAAAAQAAARPAAEPERKPAAPAETVPAPAPPPEAKAETPAEKITFDTTRFYEVNEDINDLATDKRHGLKAYDVVYLPPDKEIQPDGSITVKTSNNEEITSQKDYLTHLGGKDWGVKQKEKFMADFYEKETGVDRNKLHFINSTTAKLGGTVSSITNRVVEVTQSNAGVGLSTVKLETGAEINVKTADLEKVTDEAKINRYIIDRYQNRIS